MHGVDDYYRTMQAHKTMGCVCTQPGIEGDKARAGQFWIDGRDIRETPHAPDATEREQ